MELLDAMKLPLKVNVQVFGCTIIRSFLYNHQPTTFKVVKKSSDGHELSPPCSRTYCHHIFLQNQTFNGDIHVYNVLHCTMRCMYHTYRRTHKFMALYFVCGMLKCVNKLHLSNFVSYVMEHPHND